MLQHFIQSGATRYDFLGGINAHKQNWGARPGSYLNLSFAAPWSLGSFYITFDQLATWGKEWLRQHLPSAAWNVLHRVKLSVTCGTGETPSNINAVPTSNT